MSNVNDGTVEIKSVSREAGDRSKIAVHADNPEVDPVGACVGPKGGVKLGDKLDKPVVATGNAHYLDEEDYIYRKILVASQGGANPLNKQTLPKVHFRTTDEMIQEFQFLGNDIAEKVVIDATNHVADLIEEIQPIPDDLYTPKIEGADDEVRQMSYNRARSIYGTIHFAQGIEIGQVFKLGTFYSESMNAQVLDENSAIFQALNGERYEDIDRLSICHPIDCDSSERNY